MKPCSRRQTASEEEEMRDGYVTAPKRDGWSVKEPELKGWIPTSRASFDSSFCSTLQPFNAQLSHSLPTPPLPPPAKSPTPQAG